MRFLVLGPLEVHGEAGPVSIGSPKERRLLAALLARCGETVSADFLIDAVWDRDPPRSAAKTLQSYVVHLRHALEAGGAGAPSPIVTRGGGYSLEVSPDDVDAEAFRDLSTLGRRAAERGDLAGAHALLDQALGLWRGAAYADFTEAPFAASEARSLEELRLAAVESRIDVDLTTGGRPDLVVQLTTLTTQHATREKFWAQLIHALYQAGRQGEALDTYQRARTVLLDELGIEPGHELREMHAAVLRQDPSLHAYDLAGNGPLPTGLAVAGPSFEGRADDLAWLRRRWTRAVVGEGGVVVISGPAGIGKTRLLAELGFEVHRSGGAVTYVAKGRTPNPEPLLAASGGRPVLVLVDEPQTSVSSAIVAGRPALMVVTVNATRSPGHVRDGFPDAERLDLEPLGDAASRRVVQQYVGPGPAKVGVDDILRRAAGIPALLHELAATEVERATMSRIEAATERASGTRARLAEARLDLQEGLTAWQRGRAQRFANDTSPDEAMPRCPYKGLRVFEQADATIFHGRDAMIASILARICEVRLVAVVGASGAGKSSLVRAGVLASLADGSLPGSVDWLPRVLVPGDPVPSLVSADAATMVVVVDQFEEAWTMLSTEHRTRFLDQVVGLAEGGHRVIVALRADFVDRCAEHAVLSGLVADGTVLVGPMSDAEVRQAVLGPAEAAGLTVDPRLVDQLVDDVRAQPGALPLMSAALADVWERRTGNRLTISAYLHAGGVSGSVARMAEETFAALSEAEQVAARRLLVRLATTDEGSFVRRRVPLAELDTDRSTERALEAMVDRRLLSIDRGCVEVAHEALFDAWPRLAGWLADDEQGRLLRKGLTPAALEWAGDRRSSGHLYRGVRLDAVLERFETSRDDLTQVERQFIEASVAESQRELTEQQDRAEREAMGRRRLRVMTAVIAASLVAALIAAGAAVVERRNAEDTARRAVSRQLGSAALVEDKLDRSLLLATAAVRVDDSVETRGDLLTALQRSPAARQVRHGDGDRLLEADLSSDGRTLVVGDNNGTIASWTGEGNSPATLAAATEDGFVDIAARPGTNEMILSSLGAGGPQVPLLIRWDPERGVRVGEPLRGATTPVDSLTWSRDGRWLAANQDIGDVLVWDFEHLDRRPVHVPTNHERLRSVASAGGRLLLLVEENGAASVWRPGAERAMRQFEVGQEVSAVESTPDGSVVAIGHRDGSAALWDTRSGKRVRPLTSHGAQVNAVIFDRRARTVASLGDDRAVIVSDVSSGDLIETLTGHSGRVTAGAFAADGRTLYTTSLDASLIVWDLSGERRLGAGFPQAAGVEASWTTLGSAGVVAVSQPDGHVRFWDGRTRRPLGEPVDGGQDGIISADFSPDGAVLATAGPGGTVRLWDVPRQAPAEMIRGLPGDANEIQFSPDGSLLAVCVFMPDEARIIVLDAATHEQVGKPIVTGWGVPQLAWSPDSAQFAVGSWEVPDVNAYDARDQSLTWSADVGEGNTSDSVGWSPDGSRVAAGDGSGAVRFFDSDNGEPRGVPLEGHAGPTVTTSYSPDGTLLATSGTDGRVIVRDADSGRQLGAPLAASDNVYTMSTFDRDGRLFVASADGAMWLWDMDLDSWLERACLTAGRGLSRDEWSDLDTGWDFETACP